MQTHTETKYQHVISTRVASTFYYFREHYKRQSFYNVLPLTIIDIARGVWFV